MRRLALAALLAAVATAPAWVWNPYHLHTLIMAGIFAVLALSLNLLLGYTGQLSLGHAAFFGIGAYATALSTLRLEWSPWVGLLAAAALPAGAGWLIGRLALKLRGAYFVLLTISFAGVVSLVSVNWMDLTNGPLGLPGVPPVDRRAARGCPRSRCARRAPTTTSCWPRCVLAYLVCLALVRSRVGRALVALRENETLAESVGHRRHALPGAGGGDQRGAWPGWPGWLYAHYTRFVSPEVFLFSYTVTMVIMVVAGGKGTLAGPVVGAVIFTALPEVLREITSWQWQMLALRRAPDRRALLHAAGHRADPPRTGAAGRDAADPRRSTGLTVRFGGVAALGGVSFDVTPGTVTSLIGPNGAGKTTAFNVITGFQRPAAGRVSHEGVAITGWRPHRIAARGLVRTFQKTSLFPGLSVRGQRADRAAPARPRSAWPRRCSRAGACADGRAAARATEAARVIDFVGLGRAARRAGDRAVVRRPAPAGAGGGARRAPAGAPARRAGVGHDGVREGGGGGR